MSLFRQRLAAARVPDRKRRWLFVPYDQLSSDMGPLAREPAGEIGIVLVETTAKAERRPYHKQKLAILLANQRHFALEQAARGVAVRYLHSDQPYVQVIHEAAGTLGPMRMMRPAERELRHELAPLVSSGVIDEIAHEGWLTTDRDFHDSQSGPPWRMDAFYRHVRRRTGVLMDGDAPEGGRFSFDTENRLGWKGEPPPPPALSFAPDPITDEVVALVQDRFAHHPGEVDRAFLPATRADAQRLWKAFLAHGLASFGPYEDAMTTASWELFHARVSPVLNLHRLLPRQLVDDVAGAPGPLASREGFIRQVLGWREFVRHVHEATDGFRRIDGRRVPTLDSPGDGGYARWAGKPWPAAGGDGGALPSALEARRPLPPAFWGKPSGLACLDHVVEGVWRTGYSHHITRLMVLANLATLLDLDPRAVTDWFWVAYADAYDWVVEPNVLGMGTYAAGPVMTTKPYVAGSAYIQRMSDYCGSCAFDPKSTCPITPMYWAFLARQRARLDGNPRMLVPLKASDRREPAKRAQDAATFDHVSATLARGERLLPAAAKPPAKPRRR
jgi:deoxyribodipyrimidine photolyase-related protein